MKSAGRLECGGSHCPTAEDYAGGFVSVGLAIGVTVIVVVMLTKAVRGQLRAARRRRPTSHGAR